MLNRIIRLMLFIMTVSFSQLTIAQQAITTTTTPTTPAQQSSTKTIYCPPASQLVKNGLYWGTPTGGWKSYSESFVDSVTSFVGAQWMGINVGRMICIYTGEKQFTFPVTLQNDTIVPSPTGGKWGADLGGYKFCYSNNMADCPFIVPQTPSEGIYEGLDFYKGKPNPLLNDNSETPNNSLQP